MESVMNFLAENYIWFFVAAGVLLFALIGFLIDNKNKSKHEFKGESIETNDTNNVSDDLVETIDLGDQIATSVDSNPIEESAPAEEIKVEEPISQDISINEEVSSEPETFETPVFEEKPVNPELENNETITFGTIPEISREDMADMNNNTEDENIETLNN